MGRVFRDALDRADFHALRGVKVTHAFGAFHRVNFINFDTLVNGFIRAFGFTHIAIDALFGDSQCQGRLPAETKLLLQRGFDFHTDKLRHVPVQAGHLAHQR